MNVIECEDLIKLQGNIKALDHLSFAIRENTITGLIGRNGAGKTTLLKILAGLWKETSGEMKVFSEKPFNNLKVSTKTIYVDDLLQFPQSLTLKDILLEAERFYPNWDSKLAFRLFEYFSFSSEAVHDQLSKGRKSTFNMILGLASRCPLTIFDEPTIGMDAAVRKDFYRALLKDYIDHPRTIIISSHHLEEIHDLIEDVLLLQNGRKYFHMSIDDLKEYAIGLTGRTEIVIPWMQDKEVYHTKHIGTDSTYAVVRNKGIEIAKAKKLGMEISLVSPSDLCVYMTNQTKGGIDDVFK